MYVMTIDQRGSSTDIDRVPELLDDLRRFTNVRFERSVGDEVQGVVDDPAAVVEVALHALRSGLWYVGIGVGPVNLPQPASPREGSGTAFVAARRAVDRAKAAASHVPLAVVSGGVQRGLPAPAGGGARGSDPGRGDDGVRACANAEAVLRLIGRLVRERTEAQWRVIDALRAKNERDPGRHGLQKQVARELGISDQSVSRAILRSGWQEEWAARPAAEMLLATAHRLIPDTVSPDASNRGER
ncbi:MarR family transcriptional regulator [Arthrobacter sp. ZGTC131]|uniref:MarR family transcriptional regulator n=1 Tax=Arthrobacter sp. ZGTC131 TaxID=2058898 RepID=UPI000CE2CDEB|nr:MarR family transcriptional regulator [Arthrobacter sp. ZGTC131]